VLAALAAASAESAYDMTAGGVDIVLMDMVMARMDGVAAVGEMRRAGVGIPVIAVTGNAEEEEGGDEL
jgi:CheY-like chemotaxis protein